MFSQKIEESTDEATQTTTPAVSRRGFGKRLLLGASALAVTAALSKTEEASAAPLTDTWKLGGNTGVNTDGSNFIGTLNVAPLIFKVTKTVGTAPTERMRITPGGTIGIGTTAPAGLLHSKLNSTAPALLGENIATVANASGVLGRITSAIPGVDSAAVRGENKGTNGNGSGVHGSHAGSGYGVRGTSVNSAGVYGEGSRGVSGSGNTAIYGDGLTYGVEAFGNTGVYAYGSAGDGLFAIGSNRGVYAAGAVGVYGQTQNGTGVKGISSGDGSSVSGVFGQSTGLHSNGVIGESNNGDKSYGVWGKSTNGFAGYFSGKVTVTGNLAKGGGSFKIDHPLDPENKYLYHSFVESPDMMNIYNGNVTLDAKGEATIEMPAYFGALNRDLRYQLTPIGAAVILYIAEEIKGNRFKIAGGKPGMRVSWQVTGIRQDAYANANRIPVEEVKSDKERGTYLHPAAHGKPESADVNAERVMQLQQRNADRPSQGTQPVTSPNQ